MKVGVFGLGDDLVFGEVDALEFHRPGVLGNSGLCRQVDDGVAVGFLEGDDVIWLGI